MKVSCSEIPWMLVTDYQTTQTLKWRQLVSPKLWYPIPNYTSSQTRRTYIHIHRWQNFNIQTNSYTSMLPVAHYPKVCLGTICWDEISQIMLRRRIQDLRKASYVTGLYNEKRRTKANQRRTRKPWGQSMIKSFMSRTWFFASLLDLIRTFCFVT